MKILALIVVAACCSVTAHAQSSDSTNKPLRLRMFAERTGDLYWMDTKSIVAGPNGNADVTVYIVKGGYPSERQQLSAACCGKMLFTRVAEGVRTHFRFDCSGNYTYAIDGSQPLSAAPLSVAYNIAQFACGGLRCKLNGIVCSE